MSPSRRTEATVFALAGQALMDDDDQDLRQMGVEDLLAFLGGLVGGPAVLAVAHVGPLP
jgi:hypothetical protein